MHRGNYHLMQKWSHLLLHNALGQLGIRLAAKWSHRPWEALMTVLLCGHASGHCIGKESFESSSRTNADFLHPCLPFNINDKCTSESCKRRCRQQQCTNDNTCTSKSWTLEVLIAETASTKSLMPLRSSKREKKASRQIFFSWPIA